MTVLAQTAAPAAPAVEWSTFAPELVVAGAALVVLLLVVAGRARAAVASLIGVGVAALGVVLTIGVSGAEAEPVVGAIVVALGIALPAIVVAFAATPRWIGAGVAGIGLLGGLAVTLWQVPGLTTDGAVIAMQGSVALDEIALLTRITVYASALIVLLMSPGYLADRGIDRAEFEPLLLLSATGMALFGAANDLITLFVALEILSISLYVMCGLARRDRRSQESAVKYFVLGAIASAILVYGLALLYLATGTLELPEIATRLTLAGTDPRVAVAGIALVTVGIGFKVAMAPFQLWTPDVYQGAPTNVTAFMAAATKAAAFAALLRLYLVGFAGLDDLWVPLLAVLAAVTMLYGAVVAILQQDLKRILAYSSIAHAGYALIGVVAASPRGVTSTLWYLLTYAVSTLLAFGAVIVLERQRRGEVTLAGTRGLGRTSPILAGVLALGLLSLAGIPPTAGFAGKLLVFQAGVAAGQTWLVVVGVVSTVIAAFFYLRVIGAMFLEEPEAAAVEPDVPLGLSVGVSISAAATVYLGVAPALVLDLADRVVNVAR